MADVVTCVLMNDKGKILILKRSDKVGTYKGQWSGVSGYIEIGEKPIETAYKEIKEEVGFEEDEVELIKEIKPIKFKDIYEEREYFWIVHAFLFKVISKRKIEIDWEHIKYRWIGPSDLKKFDTVPHFLDVVSKSLKKC